MNANKGETKEKEIVFYLLLKGILNEANITKDNFEKEFINYTNSKELISFEKKFFELLLYLPPLKENFNSLNYKKFIYQIMKLLLIKKGNKILIKQIKGSEERKNIVDNINKSQEVINEIINPDEIMQICTKAFEEDELLSILPYSFHLLK